jgi:23S rRNA (guanosine2251-2'-O)-methyltransferase
VNAPRDPARLVLGLNPVREAVRVHGAALRRVAVDDRALPRLEALARFAHDAGVGRVDRVPRAELDRLAAGASHQGVAAWAPPLVFTSLEALAEDPALLAVALDELQDPQNFGAVVRSAVGLGRAAVLFGEHAAAPLTPATFRASAGAIEHARLCRVRSLTTALGELAASAVQVVGLDAQASQRLSDLDLALPTVLVLGNEGEGLGRSVRRACTTLAQLAPPQAVDSLNVSVAAGIALYEATRQRWARRAKSATNAD